MPQKAEIDPTIVDARPTKEFFISMLTKDIELSRCVIDLVDNALDGARRLRKEQNYDGLFVKIDATSQHFKIEDNCGGIDITLARGVAFRFGRPSAAKPTSHSVGQFGVGMKRALFKIGRRFSVRSDAPTSWFTLTVDVDEWKKSDEEWDFQFDDYREGLEEREAKKLGTSITVTRLRPEVSQAFEDENFQARLGNEIREAHTQTIEKGLKVSLGGVPLGVRPLLFLQSKELIPALHEMTWGRGSSEVQVKLYAGVGDSKPSDAGWNIFCNGRLVLAADKEFTTGWGEGAGRIIPHYHPQYARFRGYAFLDSDDTSTLPWNTTKTGVDTDSPHYKTVRLEMVKLMRPVVDFLNNLANEKKSKTEDDRPLENAVSSAKGLPLSESKTRRTFQAPKSVSVAKKQPDVGRISYWKPKREIDRAKKKLRVSAGRDVGEKTFEYFYKRECED